MWRRIGTLVVVTLTFTSAAIAGEAAAVGPERYRVEAVGIPEGDLSGALGNAVKHFITLPPGGSRGTSGEG